MALPVVKVVKAILCCSDPDISCEVCPYNDDSVDGTDDDCVERRNADILFYLEKLQKIEEE